VKSSLIHGEFQFSEQLVINKLAKKIGTSRQPFMDALKRLSAEGFIEIIPQVGCRVISPPGAKEIRDFYALFASVESLSSELAAVRHTHREFFELQQCAATMRELRANCVDKKDIARSYWRLNRKFHGQIHLMSRSDVVSSVAESLWDRSSFYIAGLSGNIMFSERLDEANDEHDLICDAIGARDQDRARHLARAHIAAVGEALLLVRDLNFRKTDGFAMTAPDKSAARNSVDLP